MQFRKTEGRACNGIGGTAYRQGQSYTHMRLQSVAGPTTLPVSACAYICEPMLAQPEAGEHTIDADQVCQGEKPQVRVSCTYSLPLTICILGHERKSPQSNAVHAGAAYAAEDGTLKGDEVVAAFFPYIVPCSRPGGKT